MLNDSSHIINSLFHFLSLLYVILFWLLYFLWGCTSFPFIYISLFFILFLCAFWLFFCILLFYVLLYCAVFCMFAIVMILLFLFFMLFLLVFHDSDILNNPIILKRVTQRFLKFLPQLMHIKFRHHSLHNCVVKYLKFFSRYSFILW